MILTIGITSFSLLTKSLSLNLPFSTSNAVNHRNELFFVESQLSGTYRLLKYDPVSSRVENSIPVNDRPLARLSPDKSVLYLFDTNWNTNLHTLSALGTETLDVIWQVNIPSLRTSFVPGPNDGIWFSQDGNSIYLWDTVDDLLPHIFVIDVQSHEIVRDFQIELPYPAVLKAPTYWKLPWSEQLVILSGTTFFLVDLTNGQSGSVTRLSDFENVGQIPKNLPQDYVQVYGGEVDPQTRTLILATSAQELIFVDLSKEPFETKKVLSLPQDWQFSGLDTLFLEADKQRMYIQVKKLSSGNDLSEPDEVWTYNTRSWKQIARINANNRLNIDLATTKDIDAYPISKNGVLLLGKDSNGNDFGGLSPIEENSLFFLVP
jgi:hypothetical protein